MVDYSNQKVGKKLPKLSDVKVLFRRAGYETKRSYIEIGVSIELDNLHGRWRQARVVLS